MYFEIVKQFPHGHMTIFLEGDTQQEACSKTHGNVVAVKCLGPSRIPDTSKKRGNGYSRQEWQEVRHKTPRRGKDRRL